MLKFVPYHLKIKNMYKHPAKLTFLIKYIQYKTQQICDKAILEIGEKLKSLSDCCKNQ